MSIAITSSLQPTSADTPLDVRTVVATLADIPDIQMPFIGMLIYVKATAKYYTVASLKAKTVGAITVDNAQIDAFQELASAYRPPLLLSCPDTDEPLFLTIQRIDQTTGTATTVLDTENNAEHRALVQYFDGTTFQTMPAAGIPPLASSLAVIVSLQNILADGSLFRLKWSNGDSTQDTDWQAGAYPASCIAGAFGVNSLSPAGGTAGQVLTKTSNSIAWLDPATPQRSPAISSAATELNITPAADIVWTPAGDQAVLSASGGTAGYNASILLDVVLGATGTVNTGSNISLRASFASTFEPGKTNRCVVFWHGTAATIYIYDVL